METFSASRGQRTSKVSSFAMKIGLTIPCYNSERTIAATIDSILSQDYPSLDLLVIDGASTDRTMDIVKSYGDQLRWISEPDRGQTDAINKGLKKITGDIIKWVNSDDVLTPGTLERVSTFFTRNPDCDFVYGDIEFIDMEGKVVGIHKEPSFSPFVMLYGHNLFADPASFWRAEAMKSINYLDSDIRYSMDYEMWVKFHRQGFTFRHLPIVFAQYRIEQNNASIANQQAMRIEHYKILTQYTPWLTRLPENIRHGLLLNLLFIARIYKKAKTLLQRRKFDLFIFAKQVKKARS